jgi:hypothetical protein
MLRPNSGIVKAIESHVAHFRDTESVQGTASPELSTECNGGTILLFSPVCRSATNFHSCVAIMLQRFPDLILTSS